MTKRRSEKMPPEAFLLFKEKYESFELKRDLQEFFGIAYQKLDNLLLKGTSSPDTIQKVKEKLDLK